MPFLFQFLCLFFFISTTFAVPFHPPNIVPQNPFFPPNGRQMFIFAYCVYSENAEKQKECLKNNLTGSENSLWKLEISESMKCDLKGNSCSFMIAKNEERRQIVVSFRGTTTLKQIFDEIWESLANECVPFGGNGGEGEDWPKGYVNPYFYSALTGKWHHRLPNGVGQSIWERIVEIIEGLVDHFGYESVIFTGHSLGGAFASLAALLLFERKIPGLQQIHHSSYGQPRVGCPKFAQYFEENIKNSHRFVHGNDIVAAIPPESNSIKCTKCNSQGYRHHGEAVVVKREPCDGGQCSNSKDCIKCHGQGICLWLIGCLSRWHLPSYLTDHFEYFNLNISNKVHIFTLMDMNELNLMDRIKKLISDLMKIVNRCFDKKEIRKLEEGSSSSISAPEIEN